VTDNRDLSRAMIAANSLHMDETRPLLGITLIPGAREGRLVEGEVKMTFD